MQQGVHDAAALPPTFRDDRVSLLRAARPPRAPSQSLPANLLQISRWTLRNNSGAGVVWGVSRERNGRERCGDEEHD